MAHKFEYPTAEAIMKFNDAIVKERHETYSLEDREALIRILNKVQEEGEDLPVDQAIKIKASRLLYSITFAQPFYEGNKETALAVTKVFLDKNGYELVAQDEEIFNLLTGIINASQDLNSTKQFLSIHVSKK